MTPRLPKSSRIRRGASSRVFVGVPLLYIKASLGQTHFHVQPRTCARAGRIRVRNFHQKGHYLRSCDFLMVQGISDSLQGRNLLARVDFGPVNARHYRVQFLFGNRPPSRPATYNLRSQQWLSPKAQSFVVAVDSAWDQSKTRVRQQCSHFSTSLPCLRMRT